MKWLVWCYRRDHVCVGAEKYAKFPQEKHRQNSHFTTIYYLLHLLKFNLYVSQEKFEDIKGVINIRKWRKTDNTITKRKTDKRTSNDLQNTTQRRYLYELVILFWLVLWMRTSLRYKKMLILPEHMGMSVAWVFLEHMGMSVVWVFF
jgi:hypothetical protein